MPNLISRFINDWRNSVELDKRRACPEIYDDKFYFLDKDKEGNYIYRGEIVDAFPVGNRRRIIHPARLYLSTRALTRVLNEIKYTENTKINAVHTYCQVETEVIGDVKGRTYLQPIIMNIPK